MIYFAFFFLNFFSTDWTRFWHMKIFFFSSAKPWKHPFDIRYHIPGTPHHHTIANFYSKSFYLILIVKRCSAYGNSGYLNRAQNSNRSQNASPPHLDNNIFYYSSRFFGRKFESHHSARSFPHHTKIAREFIVVD